MTEINENKIKLSGMANLLKAPKRTNLFVDLTMKKATIIGDIDLRDNEDGTLDQIFKLKITPETEITILAENEILEAKKNGSQSQALRMILMEYYNQQFAGKYDDFETFYKEQMAKIIKNISNCLL